MTKIEFQIEFENCEPEIFCISYKDINGGFSNKTPLKLAEFYVDNLFNLKIKDRKVKSLKVIDNYYKEFEKEFIKYFNERSHNSVEKYSKSLKSLE